ncbi:DUF3631 domain-containing protein, partial [Streptomyces ipomoeae]|uniref:DUF3631 domain-containing protein n=1 Tax=Streptomyces ipomoeae TaxID=103232 RepID=UPI0011476F6A
SRSERQQLLRDFGIKSATHRFDGGRQAKGFARVRFADAWARYSPQGRTPESGDESAPQDSGLVR